MNLNNLPKLYQQVAVILLLSLTFFPVSVSAIAKSVGLTDTFQPTGTADTQRILEYEKRATYYLHRLPDSSYWYANEGLARSIQQEFVYGEVACLNLLGAYFAGKGCPGTALSYFQCTAQHMPTRDVQVLRKISTALNQIGIIRLQLGDLSAAEYLFRKALRIDKRIGNKAGVAISCCNLGQVMLASNKPYMALLLFNKSWQLQLAIGQTSAAITTMANLASLHICNNNLERATAILLQAEAMNISGYPECILSLLNLRAAIATKQMNYVDALHYRRQALRAAEKSHDRPALIAATSELADLCFEMDRFAEAGVLRSRYQGYLAQATPELQKAKLTDMRGILPVDRLQPLSAGMNTDDFFFYDTRLFNLRNGLILSLGFSIFLAAILYKAYRDKRYVNSELMRKFQEVRARGTVIDLKNQEIEAKNNALMEINHTLSRHQLLLKESQRIARLGSWEYTLSSGTFVWSEELEYLFFEEGFLPKQLNIRSFLSQIAAADLQLVMDAVRNAALTGDVAEVQFRISKECDEVLFMKSRISPLRDSKGVLQLLTGTVADVSDQKRIEMHLREAKEQAELASRSKSLFLATMSHEIRTPLNAILGFTDVLSKECLAPQQTEYLSHIRSAGDNLMVLLNDILDLNTIESGKLELERVNFNLREMVDQAAFPYKMQAEEKGLQFKVCIDTDVPLYLNGDPHRIRQLLVNYLSNAIKFTPVGAIQLSVCKMILPGAEIGGKLKLKCTVSDTGIGVPADKIEHIFDAFTQADSSATRKYNGTGLGLAINQQLSQLMGGSTGLESPGQLVRPHQPGTDFWFEIVVEPGVHQEPIKAIGATASAIRFAVPVQVLVAEDNMINQLLIRKVLESMNCVVTLVENGKMAVDALAGKGFDAILMDIQMPEMDGHQATMLIRQKLNADIPIIGISANVFKEDIRKSLSVGMDAHLGKPFKASELFEVMKNLISRNQAA